MNNITIEYWTFPRIVVLLSFVSVVITVGSYMMVSPWSARFIIRGYVFRTGSFYVAWL